MTDVERDEGPRGPLEVLLALQDIDLGDDQLRHRREHMPQAQLLRDIEKRRDDLVAKSAATESIRGELLARQNSLESDIGDLTSRIAVIEGQLSLGSAASFRDQAAMGNEIASLASRRGHLEDDELEVMEELEPVSLELDERDRALLEIDEEVVRLLSDLHREQLEIDSELDERVPSRAKLASELPPPLLSEYERIRGRSGGVGAARLEHGVCSGCHLSLSATELDAIHKAPEGSFFHCEQCGRILVPSR